MPEFRLRVWSTQTLHDANDYLVTADTAEAAAEMISALQDAAQDTSHPQPLPTHIASLDHHADLRVLDPTDIIDGERGIVLLDGNGKKVRDLVVGDDRTPLEALAALVEFCERTGVFDADPPEAVQAYAALRVDPPAVAENPKGEAARLVAPNGCEIKGTLETLSGVALIFELSRAADGTVNFEYEGETKIWWDEQKTVRRHGNAVFVDTEGNEWTEDRLVPAEAEEGAE